MFDRTLGDRFEAARRIDLAYERVAQALTQVHPPQVTLVRYQSLDPIGHYFLRYAMPSEFGDVTDDERRRLGPRARAALRGRSTRPSAAAMAALGPDDLLLVVSGYGMEPLGVVQAPCSSVRSAIPDVSGTHERRPTGFCWRTARRSRAADCESAARSWTSCRRCSIFSALPIGRDMDGYARTDLFQRAFTDERPITFIPTYDR